MKKLVVIGIIALAVISLSSCRSKKKGASCGYTQVNTQEKVQDVQQDVVTACIDEE
jgi:uncharacterized lipoprotein YbaY